MTKECSDTAVNGSTRQQTSVPPSNVQWIGLSSNPVLARIEGPLPGQVWLVTKPSVVIGRQSTSQSPDIGIGTNSYVSRAHLVLERVPPDLDSAPWLLTCNGKNGVFLDGQIVKKTESDRRLELPHKCRLRFPSTELVYDLHILYAPPRDGASPSMSKSSSSVGDSQDSGFVSPSKDETDADDKPNYSYVQLITQAIAASPERKCTLSGIYTFISRNYAYYGATSENGSNNGWQNSVRHNLSLNQQFVRLQKDASQAANKGAYWKFAEQNGEECLVASAFTTKRAGTVQAGKARQQNSDQLIIQGDNAGVVNGSNQLPLVPSSTGYGESQPAALQIPNGDKKIPIGEVTLSAPSSPGYITALQRARTNTAQLEAACHRTIDAIAHSDISRQHNPSGGSHSSGGTGTRRNTPTQMVGGGGATFKVSSSTKDGRNRLQLCHTPPEYVTVTIPGQSALGQMSYRHRGNKGNVESSKALLQQYRGGSKSLSTTPVRDLLNHGSLAKELLAQGSSAVKSRKRRAESGSGKHNAKFPVEAKSASTMSSPTFGNPLNLEHLATVANTARLVEQARDNEARQRELQRQINMLVQPGASSVESSHYNGGHTQSSNSLMQSVAANLLQNNTLSLNGFAQSSTTPQSMQQVLIQMIAQANSATNGDTK